MSMKTVETNSPRDGDSGRESCDKLVSIGLNVLDNSFRGRHCKNGFNAFYTSDGKLVKDHVP